MTPATCDDPLHDRDRLTDAFTLLLEEHEPSIFACRYGHVASVLAYAVDDPGRLETDTTVALSESHEDPQKESEFWRGHYDQAADDAERAAGAW